MAGEPGWAPTLQWGVWALAMAVVMGWVARSRQAVGEPEPRRVLAHPRSTLIVGVVCSGFFLFCAAASLLVPGKNGSPLISLLFLAFAALGLSLLLDYRNARHTLAADGLQYGKMLGRGGLLRWVEVRRLTYSQTAKWFRLDLADGRVVRVSAMLVGLPEFAQAALAQVPAAAIDEETRSVLEATAAGNLPPVWQ